MLAQVVARPRGPLLVADAHRLRRRRVIVVELIQDALPVVGAAQLAGAARQVLGKLVVGGPAALAQLAGVEAEQLLPARVALVYPRLRMRSARSACSSFSRRRAE